MEKKFSFSVRGDYALFTDPATRLGGEKCSYRVPTYQALIGICEAVYWKPTFYFVIDRLRVMKPIVMATKALKNIRYDGGPGDPVTQTYLKDVAYQVECHMEWDLDRDDLANDRDERKHGAIFERFLKKGGKRDVFLGARECVGFVEPCEFGERASVFDNVDVSLGVMFHSYLYPKKGQDKLYATLCEYQMRSGVIEFSRPEEIETRREVRDYAYKQVTVSPERERYEREV